MHWEDLPVEERNKIHNFYAQQIAEINDELDTVKLELSRAKEKSSMTEFRTKVYESQFKALKRY